MEVLRLAMKKVPLGNGQGFDSRRLHHSNPHMMKEPSQQALKPILKQPHCFPLTQAGWLQIDIVRLTGTSNGCMLIAS